ncbi:hypothetical protein [Azospirillum largimobile]
MSAGRSDALLAFYDLAVAPATFDVVLFLVLAEAERRRRGLVRLHVVIVPGPSDGFRDGGNPFTTAQSVWRLSQLLVAAVCLLPGRPAVSVASSREETVRRLHAHRKGRDAPPVFPPDYDPAAPYPRHHFPFVAAAHGAGADVRPLAASAAARGWMRRWLDGKARAAGRPVVALVLREAPVMPERNSRLPDWAAFARRLSRDGFLPVVLRDADTAARPLPPSWGDAVACPAAVRSLDLRMALYELSAAVMQVNNGPAALAHHSAGVAYATLKMLADSPVTTDGYMRRVAQPPGASYAFAGPRQRLVWAEDDLPALVAAFEALLAPETPAPIPDVADTAPDGLLRLAGRLHRQGDAVAAVEDCARLIRLLPPDSVELAAAHHGHGLALAVLGDGWAALQALEKAHAIAPGDRRHARAGARLALELAMLALEQDSLAAGCDLCVRAAALDAGERRFAGPLARTALELARRLLAADALEEAERASSVAVTLSPASEPARRIAAAVQEARARVQGRGAEAVARRLAAYRLRRDSALHRRRAAEALRALSVPPLGRPAAWDLLVANGTVDAAVAILESGDNRVDIVPAALALLHAGPWWPQSLAAAAEGRRTDLARILEHPIGHAEPHGRLLRAVLAARRIDEAGFAPWFEAVRGCLRHLSAVPASAVPPTLLTLLGALAWQSFWRDHPPPAEAAEREALPALEAQAGRSPKDLLVFALYGWPGRVPGAAAILSSAGHPLFRRLSRAVIGHRPEPGPPDDGEAGGGHAD